MKVNKNVLVQNYVITEIEKLGTRLNLNLHAEAYNSYIRIWKGEIPTERTTMFMPKKLWKNGDLEKVLGYVMSRI